MQLDVSRLRRGELIALGSALLLLVFLFFFKWYGASGALASRSGLPASASAWDALRILRWLMLLTILAAVALAYLQASRAAPALPVSAAVIVSTLGGLLLILLIYRVLINEPGPDNLLDRQIGSFLGLLSAAGITYGGYRSLRQEGLPARDAKTHVETVVAERGGGRPPSQTAAS